jgi:hypothetical protein
VNPKLRFLPAAAVVAVFAFAPSSAAAQAFTLPQGVGAVTLAWQYVDNTGHLLSDGYLRKAGQSVTMSADFELDYGVTDRLSGTFGIPLVFAKYTGALPPPSMLPVDACRCWHSTFQDFSLAARYRFGDDPWAVTPVVRYIRPSHDYSYKGEAVAGRDLQEGQIGVFAAARLGFLPNASVQAGYTYAFVEKVLDIPLNRSNGYIGLGYALSRRLYVHADGLLLWTHGGLRAGSVTGHPFPFPGELGPPGSERFAQRDRILKVRNWKVGGGLSYSAGPVDFFAAITKYVWGRDSHDGQAYTAGATWYFGLPN